MAQQLKTLVFDKIDEPPHIARLVAVVAHPPRSGEPARNERSEILLTKEEVLRLSDWLFARFQFLLGRG